MAAPAPMVAHGPRMPPLLLLSFARPVMLDDAMPEPCTFNVAAALREKIPVFSASVRPLATFQI